MHGWDTRRIAKAERIAAGRAYAAAKVVDPQKLNDLLHNVIRPGDRVCLQHLFAIANMPANVRVPQ